MFLVVLGNRYVCDEVPIGMNNSPAPDYRFLPPNMNRRKGRRGYHHRVVDGKVVDGTTINDIDMRF